MHLGEKHLGSHFRTLTANAGRVQAASTTMVVGVWRFPIVLTGSQPFEERFKNRISMVVVYNITLHVPNQGAYHFQRRGDG